MSLTNLTAIVRSVKIKYDLHTINILKIWVLLAGRSIFNFLQCMNFYTLWNKMKLIWRKCNLILLVS